MWTSAGAAVDFRDLPRPFDSFAAFDDFRKRLARKNNFEWPLLPGGSAGAGAGTAFG